MDLYERIMELGSMGYHCSQIIMIMTLETIGEENPQLVKAMGGLGGGIGYCHLFHVYCSLHSTCPSTTNT